MTDRQASRQTGKRSKLIIWILVSTMVLMMAVLCKGINVQAETGTPIDGTITFDDLHYGDYIGPNTTITNCYTFCQIFVRDSEGSYYTTNQQSTLWNYQSILNQYESVPDKYWNPSKNQPGSYYINNVNAFRVISQSQTIWVQAVHLDSPEDQNTTSSSVPCEHDYVWTTVNEATEDCEGLEECRCTKCGAVCASRKIPRLSDNYNYVVEKETNKYVQAKSGQTIKIDLKDWNSIPKSFFEELAKRRDITTTIRFVYNHKVYEFTIARGQTVDTSCDYYGPEKLIQLYGAKEVVTK